MMPPPTRVVLAFTAATPVVEIDPEAAAIQEALLKVKLDHAFEFFIEPDLNAMTLDCLLDLRPHIVHIGGLGTEEGALLIKDPSGALSPVDNRSFADIFHALRNDLRCVVLNASYMSAQGQELSRYIDVVVSAPGRLTKSQATTFAAKFYERLARQDSVSDAVNVARIMSNVLRGRQGNTYLLQNRLDVKPAEMRLYPIQRPLTTEHWEALNTALLTSIADARSQHNRILRMLSACRWILVTLFATFVIAGSLRDELWQVVFGLFGCIGAMVTTAWFASQADACIAAIGPMQAGLIMRSTPVFLSALGDLKRYGMARGILSTTLHVTSNISHNKSKR